jgi:ATP-dependent DNA ligase
MAEGRDGLGYRNVRDRRGQLLESNLHISLKDKKLKGEWSPRRDRSKGGTAWILEKAASCKKSISANNKDDESALNGRSMTQDAVWQSNPAIAEVMKQCCWLKPKVVAQIGIREWTAEGHLRHSTFLGLREDKNPREVIREHV